MTMLEQLKSRITPQKLQLLKELSDGGHRPPPADEASLAGDTHPASGASPAAAHTVVPTSHMQRGLWFLNQLLRPGERSSYNMPIAVRLRGALDVEVLESCLTEIVRRHEVLRTVITSQDGEPVQVIRPAKRVSVPVHEAAEESLESLVEAEVCRPFDFSAGPMFRVLLVRMGRDDHALVLTFHHAVFDGWSAGLLCEELSQLYRAFGRGEASPLTEPKVQYADFATWQQRMAETGVFARQLDYWQEQLAGAPALLDLPTDRPRPAVASYAGGQCEFVISADVTAKLRELGKSEHATLFIVLLASYQAFLSRWSGQTDISIGCGTAGRSRTEWEELIGCFVNMVVLRGEISPESTFRQLVQQARLTSLAAFDHQDVPFEQLVRKLRPDRSLGYGPLFQTALVLQPLASGDFDLAGLEAEELYAGIDEAKGDLVLDVAERPADLAGSFGFRKDLFDVSTVARLVSRFQVLLAAVAANPDVPIAQIDLLLPGERETLTTQHHGATHPPAQRTLHSLIEAHAATTPHKPAVICGTTQLTYRELNEQANHLAHTLITAGAAPDTLIGVALPRSPGLIVTLLAVLKAGAGYIALDPAHPPARLARIIGDAHPPCVISDPATAAALTTTSTPILVPQPPSPDTLPAITPAVPVSPRNLAYTIYTSGSTGQPKPVAVEHTQVVHHVRWLAAEFSVSRADVLLAHMSPGFDASVGEIWLALTAGATLCLAPGDMVGDPLRLLAYAQQHRVTIAQLGPSLLAEIPAHVRCDSLRQLITGGEPLASELAQKFAAQWTVPVANMYGPTETTVAITCSHFDRQTGGHTVPLGRPVWNTQLYVLDSAMRPVTDGAAGELYIGGAQLARGYLGRPGMTAERFVPDVFGRPGERLYRSGDVCRWRADGQLEHVCRLDHQVKIRGHRIEPGEIEAALAEHPSIRQALVVVRADTPGDQRLVAYVIWADAASEAPDDAPGGAARVSGHELRERLERSLPSYMIPSAFVPVDSWPMTVNGKLDRSALPVPNVSSSAPYARPGTPTEVLVAATWRNILLLDDLGIDDNFFDVGGHSLNAVRVFNHLANVFGNSIPVATMFTHPTVRRLANWLDTSMQNEQETPLVPIQPAGAKPPLFLVHPVGGNVLCYGALTRQLGAEQPVYGLAARGFDGRHAPLEDIEQIAASYLAAISELGHDGPYVLGGWSIGGVIAYEMARQVQRETGTVIPVVMIDTSARPLTGVLDGTATDEDFGLGVDGSPSPPGRELLARFSGLDAQDINDDVPWLADRLLRVIRANIKAVREYRPTAGYRGSILLLTAQESLAGSQDPDRGWGEWTSGQVDGRVVPGDHFSMLTEPNLPILVDELRAGLNEIACAV